MVNTFVTISSGDMSFSARTLDRQRLGKQRVEAQQILTCIEQLSFLAELFGLPSFPENVNTSPEVRGSWIKNVLGKFKSQQIYAVEVRGGHCWYHKTKPSNVSGELITTGFKSHPCVRMWLGFKTGLKYYINCHIQEWIRRGYQNTMKQYPEAETIYPYWCFDENVIDAFRSNLMEKELVRNEPTWYAQMEAFPRSFAGNRYDEFLYYLPSRDLSKLYRCRERVKEYIWC